MYKTDGRLVYAVQRVEIGMIRLGMCVCVCVCIHIYIYTHGNRFLRHVCVFARICEGSVRVEIGTYNIVNARLEI